MGATELGLRRAICATPADDTPRLAYADWLDENDQPARAEFVRVQVELAKVKPCGAANPLATQLACRYCGLVNRQRELLPPDGVHLEPSPRDPRWGHGFRDRVWAFGYAGRFPRVAPAFTRGFVSHVTCGTADWLAHADALAWHPAQTVDCPECVTAPPVGWYHKGGCPECDGTGRVPRPFPATAQPIERVALTTRPAESDLRRPFGQLPAADLLDLARRRDGPDLAKSILEIAWKGIVFDLPAPPIYHPQGTTYVGAAAP